MKKFLTAIACGALLLSGCSDSSTNKNEHAAVNVPMTSDKTFDRDVLQSKEPVLVDFYAEWCPPCKAMAPVVDDVAAEYAGKLKVFKVDVDKNPMLSQGLGIESIPTFVVFKNGKPIAANTGAMPQGALTTMVDSAFNPNVANSGSKPNL